MTITQIPCNQSEVLTLEITPKWKWEGDEYSMELSAALLSDEGGHILFEKSIPVDCAY